MPGWKLSSSSAALLLIILACGHASARTEQAGSGQVHSGAQPRNIIVIVVDDIGVENITSFNDPDEVSAPPPTPQITSFTAEGVRFTNFWAMPNCSPFRASLFTGRYAQSTGVGEVIDLNTPLDDNTRQGLDASINNLASILKRRGYRTEAFGKWHMGSLDLADLRVHPGDAGFTHYALSIGNINTAIDGFGNAKYDDWEKCTNGTCAQSTTYASTDTTDDAIAALSGTEPFFLYVAYQAAHGPKHVPPSGILPTSTYDTTCAINNNERACYKASIEALDEELGQLMDAIDRDDTAVIIVSDNGTPSKAGIIESPRTASNTKGSVYKWGVQTFMIIFGNVVPVARHNTVSTALVNSTDIFATVLDFAGVDVAAYNLDTSKSLGVTLTTANATIRDTVFVERFQPNGGTPDATKLHRRAMQCSSDHASCDVSYKLIQVLTVGSEVEEFFDKTNDDPEATDLLPYSGMSAGAKTAYDFLVVAIETEGSN